MTGFDTDRETGRIRAANTRDGTRIEGVLFILAAGAWSSTLASMYRSTLATGQVLSYTKLTDNEVEKYRDMPIYMNFSTGWFCFPPHPETKFLKCAVHGRGYTRPACGASEEDTVISSSPPQESRGRARANFAPSDGIDRLRAGFEEVLPELATRSFEQTAVCWYTDTPTGDFIIDYHPDHDNLFVANGGSGQYVEASHGCIIEC